MSWQHLSISGISQLFLTRFWWNFTGSFLGTSTGSFDRSVIFQTPIKSCQKCSLRLILAEKSSLEHDIWWIYIPFDVAKIHRKLMITESQFCFANISAREARIFMKFYKVVKYYLENFTFKFPEDWFIKTRTWVVNVRTHILSRVCGFMTHARAFVHGSSWNFELKLTR